jgi:hypothetical protein
VSEKNLEYMLVGTGSSKIKYKEKSMIKNMHKNIYSMIFQNLLIPGPPIWKAHVPKARPLRGGGCALGMNGNKTLGYNHS